MFLSSHLLKCNKTAHLMKRMNGPNNNLIATFKDAMCFHLVQHIIPHTFLFYFHAFFFMYFRLPVWRERLTMAQLKQLNFSNCFLSGITQNKQNLKTIFVEQSDKQFRNLTTATTSSVYTAQMHLYGQPRKFLSTNSQFNSQRL